MKVIAKTVSGYLVDVTKTEMATLSGFRDYVETGFREPNIGDKIDPSKIFQDLIYVRNNKHLLTRYAESLKDEAERLENIVNPFLP